MKIRLIGVDTCKNCCRLRKHYDDQCADYEYWDGNNDDLQEELDKMKIYDIPVVQILDNDKVIWSSDPVLQKSGISYKRILKIMETLK